jgi:LysR family transcriptional regulator, low CO2-responsive transcriptional regulator
MTFAQLRAFMAVMRHGSMMGAAAELYVTQPAVSSSLAALERDIGVRLLVRDRRGVRPTPSGEALAVFAAQCLGLLEQGRDSAVAAAHPGWGRVRLAAVTTAGEYVVPPILKAFQERYPRVDPVLEVGNRALILERLLAREADLAVGGRPPSEGPVVGRPFLANDLVIVAAPDHPLAGRTGVDPRLLDDTWLLREPGSGTRSTTEEFLAHHGIEPRRVFNLGSTGAVKQAAAVGLGVTLISAQAVGLELSAGTLVRLRVRGTPLRRRWFLLTLEAGFLPAPAQAFLDFASGAAARRAVLAARPPGR